MKTHPNHTPILALILMFSAPFAFSKEDSGVNQILRQLSAANITVEGTATCEAVKSMNRKTEMPCHLKVKDGQSGRTYKVTDSSKTADAIKLYEAGHKNLRIEGELEDFDVIKIKSVAAR